MAGHYVYIAADVGLVVLDLDEPLHPRVASVVKLEDARASALQFRYLFVTDKTGLRVLDVTDLEKPKLIETQRVALQDAQRIYVSRTTPMSRLVARGWPSSMSNGPSSQSYILPTTSKAASTMLETLWWRRPTTSLFAYVADGRNGLKVLQLTSPDSQPRFYGFSPEPKPELIATYATSNPALALSKGLDRDRAVDESGHQDRGLRTHLLPPV